MLLGVDPAKSPDQPIPSLYPQVTFAYMKHMWKSGQRVQIIFLFLLYRSVFTY